jgi:hypothetical protein
MGKNKEKKLCRQEQADRFGCGITDIKGKM